MAACFLKIYNAKYCLIAPWVPLFIYMSDPGGGNGNLLQYSCLKNPMDRGAWWASVHRVTKSQTQLSDQAGTEHAYMRSSCYHKRCSNFKKPSASESLKCS